MPSVFRQAAQIGVTYDEHQRHIMQNRHQGLTKTYTFFHHPTCTDSDIVALRRLHVVLDYIIMAWYGWDDLDLHHDVYPNERGQIRYTVAPSARHHIIRSITDYGIMAYRRSMAPPSDAKGCRNLSPDIDTSRQRTDGVVLPGGCDRDHRILSYGDGITTR